MLEHPCIRRYLEEREMELILNGEVIWDNPDNLGHFGIKLRKQRAEDEIIERMMQRRAAESVGEKATGDSLR